MKLVVAIIQPDKLDEVHQALIDAEIFRITVSRCSGHGQQENPDLYRGQEVKPSLLPKVRMIPAQKLRLLPLMIACSGAAVIIR